MRDPSQILIRPITTEKTVRLMQEGRYTFEVLKDANKPEIKRAVEQIFGVKVKAVNTMIVPGKPRRRGRIVGRSKSWKKAIVTLYPGYRIEQIEGV